MNMRGWFCPKLQSLKLWGTNIDRYARSEDEAMSDHATLHLLALIAMPQTLFVSEFRTRLLDSWSQQLTQPKCRESFSLPFENALFSPCWLILKAWQMLVLEWSMHMIPFSHYNRAHLQVVRLSAQPSLSTILAKSQTVNWMIRPKLMPDTIIRPNPVVLQTQSKHQWHLSNPTRNM